ncbi:hypothetical protein MKK58_01255 [Methylobacterium sp. J-078]|uniref:hypothetical protein n=1 Tax=Methylobacterium sp. J-078 TaxID=2836657 RepID=UPI001FBA33FB|nr:hypothetical protein [Methylobacterium sp. J-078]MCJ2043183.1 hypothetical protein [Methylobacterium sp. J-078]
MGAYGLIERRLAGIEADPGFEPLTIAGDEADEGDRGIAQQAGEMDDVVEPLFRRCVEDPVSFKRSEASFFVAGVVIPVL